MNKRYPERLLNIGHAMLKIVIMGLIPVSVFCKDSRFLQCLGAGLLGIGGTAIFFIEVAKYWQDQELIERMDAVTERVDKALQATEDTKTDGTD